MNLEGTAMGKRHEIKRLREEVMGKQKIIEVLTQKVRELQRELEATSDARWKAEERARNAEELAKPIRRRIPRWALDQAIVMIDSGMSCRSDWQKTGDYLANDAIQFAEKIAHATGEFGAADEVLDDLVFLNVEAPDFAERFEELRRRVQEAVR